VDFAGEDVEEIFSKMRQLESENGQLMTEIECVRRENSKLRDLVPLYIDLPTQDVNAGGNVTVEMETSVPVDDMSSEVSEDALFVIGSKEVQNLLGNACTDIEQERPF